MTSQFPSYYRYRFPPEIIGHAVWLYHRFCLALLHESQLARTMPTDRTLTCRCHTTLAGRGRSSDSGSRNRGWPHSPARLDSGLEGHLL